MNHFKFDEINVGDEVEFPYEITDRKMRLFKEITGDVNPLHNDLDYAKNKGYSEKVVYGMLTSSCLSTLAGVYMPGEYSLIHNVEIHFAKPVFVSSSPLQVHGKVISKDERFRQITLKYSIKDNKEKTVVRGTMNIGVIE